MTTLQISKRAYSVAVEAIADAERALGRLSAGQCRDLLADNTNHSTAQIRAMVQVMWGVSPDVAGLTLTD